jgi:hypothetical protein
MNTARLQFSLSSFLWFVLAAAAFAAQLAFRFDSDWGRDWRTPATVVVAWVILGHFYVANDLRELFAAHCLAPASYITLVMILLPEVRSISDMAVTGCFFGNQVSFPIFLITIGVSICRYFWRREQEPDYESEFLLRRDSSFSPEPTATASADLTHSPPSPLAPG